MKILSIVDSFKNSLTSLEISKLLQEEALNNAPLEVYKKDLVKRVNEDYHLMLKQLDKISKHETLVNELSIRIMNRELIETMVSLHKEEVLNSKVPIHETLQQSRNNIIAHNENILLYIKRYKSITKYQNEINKLNNRLEELDKKIHETTRSMEGLKDNQFV
jgi:tetrahydromethanopterin S-methyltransferase subunit G